MNTHDKDIELPEGITNHKVPGHDGPVYTDVHVRELIEADRQQRGEPVAWQRLLQAAEEMAHASHVLAGTDERNRLLAAIEAVKAPQSTKPVRGEPVAWMYEYEDGQKVLTTHLDTIQQSSKAWTPLYAAPQPTEPVKDDRVCKICDGGPGNECACSCGMRVWDTSAEPVKGPSDDEIDAIALETSNTVCEREEGWTPKDWNRYFARALLARYGQPAQPAETARLLCRKCGEKTSVSISSARLVTHFPNGMPRDARDIASDPEGKLIHEVDHDLAGYKKSPPISDVMMDLVDRLGSEYDKVELRAWEYLLIYAPKHMLTQPAASAEPHPLETYAESYEMMARAAEEEGYPATVGAYAVAFDIRHNMIPATTAPVAAQTQQDDPTPEEEEAWQRMERRS